MGERGGEEGRGVPEGANKLVMGNLLAGLKLSLRPAHVKFPRCIQLDAFAP